MPENIQVQLYRQKTQLDARTVTLNFSSNNNQTPAPVHYYVKPGTPFELVIKDCWDTLKISWNGTSKVINNNGGVIRCEIGIIDSDISIDIRGNWFGSATDAKKADPEYVKASYTTGDGVKTAIGSPITLSAANNWQYTWINENGSLLAKADDGAPYYYSVEEVSVPTGYSVSYINNNGIIVGGNEMVIINKADKKPIVLPETGGTGTYWYTMGGVLLTAGAAFLIYKKHMQKGGKRIW